MRYEVILPGQEEAVVRAAHLFDDPPEPAAVTDYLADPRNILILAYEGERCAGFLRGTELGQLHSLRRQMFLYEIAVDGRFRRQGMGRGLIDVLLTRCRERDFEEIFVFTDPANAAAVGLYRSTGAVTETPADRMFVYRLRSGARAPAK